MSPADEYTAKLSSFEAQLGDLNLRLNRVGTGRLLAAVVGLVAAFLALFRGAFALGWLLLPIAAFIGLVIYDFRVRRLAARATRGVAYFRAGLARIEDRWIGSGSRGSRFADPHHVYSADLDLFDTGGLFELLCVARTRMGEETLAKWLLEPASTTEIEARQGAVLELRSDSDFRETIALLGDSVLAGVNPTALLAWANADARLQSRWINWTMRVLAASFVAAAVVWGVTGIISPLLVVLLTEVGLMYFLKRPLNETIKSAEKTFANLDLLANVLKCIEDQRFRSPMLKDLSRSLRSQGLDASRAIERLRSIVQLIESRRNIVMALIDVPLMVSAQAAFVAEKWRSSHRSAVADWLETVGKFEALICLATYGYERPDDPFPVFRDGPAALNMEAVAHPLLPKSKAVANNLKVDAQTGVLLISGSNMSGKSTLLRTVGINIVLAMAGAPVRAQRFEMTPLQVGASIRVNDSLHEGSSRFYAEITRLKQLHELSANSPPLIALLDELLQGTNSADRRIGAQGFMHSLTNRGSIVIASTHDLALASLDGEEGLRITNAHFQDHVEGGRMKFDYKLQPGVVTKSNALELMRAIGLDVGSGER